MKAILSQDEYKAITDEQVKGLYIEKDGHFIADVSGLKTALDTERATAATTSKELKEAQKVATQFSGLKIEDVQEAIDFKRKADEKEMMDKGEFEKIRLDDQKKHSEELARWQNNYKKVFGKNQVQSALMAAGVLPEALPDATYVFMSGVNIELNGEDVEIKFLDEHGLDSGETLEKRIAAFKEKRKHFFQPSGAAGSGANSAGHSNGIGEKKRSEMSVKEKSAYIRKHGKEKYDQLPE